MKNPSNPLSCERATDTRLIGGFRCHLQTNKAFCKLASRWYRMYVCVCGCVWVCAPSPSHDAHGRVAAKLNRHLTCTILCHHAQPRQAATYRSRLHEAQARSRDPALGDPLLNGSPPTSSQATDFSVPGRCFACSFSACGCRIRVRDYKARRKQHRRRSEQQDKQQTQHVFRL